MNVHYIIFILLELKISQLKENKYSLRNKIHQRKLGKRKKRLTFQRSVSTKIKLDHFQLTNESEEAFHKSKQNTKPHSI